jgi:hypothetical protein
MYYFIIIPRKIVYLEHINFNTMPSIYSKSDNDAMIARIQKLQPNTEALWGQMNAVQMMKHANEAIIVAFGENTIAVNLMMRILGRLIKNKVFNSPEFQKNSPTAKEFIFEGDFDFESTQQELIQNYSRFAAGPQSITLRKHPFWGNMSSEDWDKLMWKHIDHHLRQFGV